MIEHRAYGWSDAGPNDSHRYLLPALSAAARRVLHSPRARVLDFGCGSGFLTDQMAKLGHDVVGIDVSEDGIVLARRAYPQARFEVGSVYDPDLVERLGGSFDLVFSFEVIEHLFYPRRLPEQAHRLLVPGGTLVVSTPYHGYGKNLAIALFGGWDRHFGVSQDGGHIKFFSRRTLREALEGAGFENVRFGGVGRVPFLWKSIIASARKPERPRKGAPVTQAP